jgi:exoribonuclease II
VSFRPFEVIKHECCIDAAFFVKKTQYVGPKYTKVRGWWITIASSEKPKKLRPNPETIKILKADLPKWKRIDVDITGLL